MRVCDSSDTYFSSRGGRRRRWRRSTRSGCARGARARGGGSRSCSSSIQPSASTGSRRSVTPPPCCANESHPSPSAPSGVSRVGRATGRTPRRLRPAYSPSVRSSTQRFELCVFVIVVIYIVPRSVIARRRARVAAAPPTSAQTWGRPRAPRTGRRARASCARRSRARRSRPRGGLVHLHQASGDGRIRRAAWQIGVL